MKQRDPALAGIHNMGRWGCAVRTAQAIAEFALHRELTARQIQEAVASLQANGVLGGSYGMFVNDWNAVMNDAFGRLGRDDMRGIKWGTEQPTFVVREWTFTEGSHFTLHRYSTNVNNRNMIYDSDPNVLANPNRRPTGHNDRPVSIQKRN
ncbi:MAG: hypothetical protein FWB78_03595 [Treponema sp.]|nr:hypothetical protein [Treponema sp.]